MPFSMYRVVTENTQALMSGHEIFIHPNDIEAFQETSKQEFPDGILSAPLSGAACIMLRGFDGAMTPITQQCLAFADKPAADRAMLNGIPMGPLAAYFRAAYDLPKIATDGASLDVSLPQNYQTMPPKEAAQKVGTFFNAVYQHLARQKSPVPVRGVGQPTP